jgi:CrcB protein
MRVMWVALGGAVGSVLRYGVSQVCQRWTSAPLGTLVVNVVGCGLLAFLAERTSASLRLSDDLRLALTVGFCGGLTTYSTFNQEMLTLWRSHSGLIAAWQAGVYVLGMFVLCALAAATGVWLSHQLSPTG